MYDADGDGQENDPVSPSIIDDGNNPEKVIWDWFEYDLSATYPKNIFIDHEMRIHAITEVDMTSEAVNEIINEMLSNTSSGCTDDTACNYDPSAFNDDGSCETAVEGCSCDSVDTDNDGICDLIDDCPNIYNPFQHDRDQDGLADACNDDDDDGDNLLDCWNYWYDDGIQMSSNDIANAINIGTCSDFALGNESPYPLSINLLNAYPNPFNPATTISFNIVMPSIVSIDIYDLDGFKIQTLGQKLYTEGEHKLIWSPSIDVSSGIYLISLKSGNSFITHKVLYLK